ncbi:hypothetical protein B4168_2525 [Anoxybacillus flavithermus]|nr:hypothetical protein B4168_2525 [Anoxybacillus flavithermus]OAO85255.1 hypothetical protein GT23_2946 [Parageobacillus thermoglucosidasius]
MHMMNLHERNPELLFTYYSEFIKLYCRNYFPFGGNET